MQIVDFVDLFCGAGVITTLVSLIHENNSSKVIVFIVLVVVTTWTLFCWAMVRNEKLETELKAIKRKCIQMGIATSTPIITYKGFKWSVGELEERKSR